MRLPLFSLLILLVGLFTIRESEKPPLRAYDDAFAVWLNTNALERRPIAKSPVVLLESPTALSPFDLSLVLKILADADASVVGIEPFLDWKEAPSAQIESLHHQLLRIPKGVLATEINWGQEFPLAVEGVRSLSLKGGAASGAEIPGFTEITRRPVESLRLAGVPGFIAVESRELAHRIPLVYRFCGFVVPSFVLQMAMLEAQVAPSEVSVFPGKEIDLGEKKRIPINASGEMRVNFLAPYTRMQVDDLLLAAEAKESPELKALEGATVILSIADSNERRYLSGKSRTQGEVFAAALSSIYQDQYLPSPGAWFKWTLLAGALLFGAAALRMGRFLTFFVGVALIVIYLFTAMNLFAATAIVLPLVLPVVLTLFVVGLRGLL